MKRSTLGAIVISGAAIVALLPLTAYAGRIVAYVTLQPTTPGIPDGGHVNVKGVVIAGGGFQGDGSRVTNVKAFGLTLPMTATSTSDGLAVSAAGTALSAISSSSDSSIPAMNVADTDHGTAMNVTSPYMGIVISTINGSAVSAASTNATAVTGSSTSSVGGSFSSSGLLGLAGLTTASGGWGVFSFGNLGASGTKSFVIDDPMDPQNYMLRHYSEEGPEPLNVYVGSAVTDAKGYAKVLLPEYFDAINKSPRYQLTVVDSADTADFALAKVVREEAGNSFTIRTNKPNVKVSWRVEAVRNDLWVQKNGAPVREEKPPQMRGKYLEPELYGASPASAIESRPQAPQSYQKVTPARR